jgi:hypothetical protein
MKVFTLCFAVAGVVFFVAGMISSANDRNSIRNRGEDNNESDSNSIEEDEEEEEAENDV